MGRLLRKKQLAACAAAVMILSAGCAQNPAVGPKNPIALEIWHYYNGPQKQAFDNLVTEFNNTLGLEKGIIVEAFSQGNVNELAEKVRAAADKKVGAQQIPDIFAAYSDTAYELDQKGLLASLDDYITKEEIAEYVPAFINEGRISTDGSIKLFPTAKSTEIMMINRTDWDKFADVSKVDLSALSTIEGVTETAQKYYEWTDSLTEEPNDGRALFGRDAAANYVLVGYRQLTGQDFFVVQDGKATAGLDKDAMKKIWDNYYIPFVNGWFCAEGRFRSDDAKTGNLISYVGSTSSATYFPDIVTLSDTESYPVKVEVMSAPCFAGKSSCAVQQGAGMAITKSDPVREAAAVTFLKWFTDIERNVEFSISSGYLPVKSMADSTKTLGDAFAQKEQTVSNDILKRSLVCGQETFQGDLYVGKAFPGSDTARRILENSMQTAAKQDRDTVKSVIARGGDQTSMLEKYNSEAYFESWYQSFCSEIKEAIGQNS